MTTVRHDVGLSVACADPTCRAPVGVDQPRSLMLAQLQVRAGQLFTPRWFFCGPECVRRFLALSNLQDRHADVATIVSTRSVTTVDCVSYRAHEFAHRWVGDGWICTACRPASP